MNGRLIKKKLNYFHGLLVDDTVDFALPPYPAESDFRPGIFGENSKSYQKYLWIGSCGSQRRSAE